MLRAVVPQFEILLLFNQSVCFLWFEHRSNSRMAAMDEFYFSAELADNHTLCLAPLTDRRISLSDQEIADSSGYFLFEKRGSGDLAGIEIIAQVFSEEAVLRLREALGMN